MELVLNKGDVVMKILILIFSAILALVPSVSLAAATAKQKEKPSISQPLVREGDYAIRLAESLKLGKLKEIQAESKLASVGIAPLSGWISDFPVTPDIVAEVKSAVDNAIAHGKISLSQKKANEALARLNKSIGLPVAEAQSTPPKGYASWEDSSQYSNESEGYAPTVINNYYYDEGPPVVTYYPPPYDYSYLYAWDPFPFWCGGFWFPGYYILTDFTRVVVINNNGTVVVNGGAVTVSGGGTVFGTGVISNHLVDPRTGKTVDLNPVTRTLSPHLVKNIPGARTTLASRNIQTMRMNALKSFSTRGAFAGAGRTGAPVIGANRTGNASILMKDFAKTGVTKFNSRSARSIFSESVARAKTRTSFGERSFRGAPVGSRSTGFGSVRHINPAPSLYGIHNGSNGFRSGANSRSARSFNPAPSLQGIHNGSNGFRGAGGGFGGGHSVRSFGAPSEGSRSFSSPEISRGFSGGGARSFGGGAAAGGFSGGARSFGGGGFGGARSFGGGFGGGHVGGFGGGCKGRC